MGASVIVGTPSSTTFVPEGTNQYHTTEKLQDVVVEWYHLILKVVLVHMMTQMVL